MNFRSVQYDSSLGKTIARVNRITGDLLINPNIWNNLDPDEKEFVLLHEQGHLVAQTKSEYDANNYAIGKFVPVGDLSNKDLARKITVLSEIQTPKRTGAATSNIDEVSATTDAAANITGSIFDTIGIVFQTLPLLGVGKKSRLAQMSAQEELIAEQAKIQESKTSSIISTVAIISVSLIVIVVLFFVFKKK